MTPGHVAEEPRLLKPVLTRRRVHYEQRLVRRAVDSALDHAPDLGQLVHQVGLRVQAAGGVDDHDVATSRPPRLDGVEGDGSGIAARRRSDEVRPGPFGPDLELLLGGGPKGVAGPDEHRATMLAQLLRELADGGRLAGAVHTHDENHGRFRVEVERRRGAEQLLDLLGERVAEVGQLAARLQSPHDLRRGANAHITVDQGFLEPLPRFLVAGVERARGDLCSQGTTALRERFAKPAEETGPLGLVHRGRLVTEELCPGSRHGETLPALPSHVRLKRRRDRARAAVDDEKRPATTRRLPS